MSLMLVNWIQQFGTPSDGLIVRVFLALSVSFLVLLLSGPLLIRCLRQNFRERIASDSQRLNELHQAKQNTPTMGGVLILASLFVSLLLFADWANPLIQITSVLALGMGSIGAWDDLVKLRTRRNGLTARQKLLSQSILSTIAGLWLFFLYRDIPGGLELHVPGFLFRWHLGWLFVPWSVWVLVGTSNGVNLTDGLDGLATGCSLLTAAGLLVVCFFVGSPLESVRLEIVPIPGCEELCVLLGALIGALLGFLWFNAHPAQVFMGDAGSLPLGAVMGFAALAARQELLLFVMGGVFVIETLSVIGQVISYKTTKKRILACSPLHNHFVFKGVNETKIVARFWIVATLLVLLGLAILFLGY